VDIGVAVHHYGRSEGTGRYTVEIVSRIAEVHRVTLYTARVHTPVPPGVTVVTVPAIVSTAYAVILSFPLAFRAVRKRHDLLHAQGWVTSSADVVTAHIVVAAWRDAARRHGVATPPGEKLFGALVQNREASLYRAGARHVIAPSRKIQDELAGRYGRTNSVSVVHHGFTGSPSPPSRAEARRRLNLPDDHVVALFVGDPRKGLSVAARAAASVTGIHLAVVSHSPEREVASLAHSAGIGNRFHWLGSLPDPALAYAAADVLVHPTIYDSFGLAVADAMSSGLPVITTSEAGIAELIEDGKSGWIVKGDPVDGTARALRSLMQDRELRRRLAEGGRTVARARTWDDVATETLEVYRRVSR
jgi:UDP-glucose:(heptosyl)LPS alpha-1,3-glucosyltransferase